MANETPYDMLGITETTEEIQTPTENLVDFQETVTEGETPTIWKHLYQALARRLVEIADEPSATTRMIDYDRVARAHEGALDDD